MKILFLLSRMEKSGVALHTLDLAQGLADEGHEIMLITGGITHPDNPYLSALYRRFSELAVEIKCFRTPSGYLHKKGYIAFISIIQILNWIVKSKADIIHSQSPYMTFLPWLLGKKCVSTVHNVQLVKNLKYKNPTALIAISKESRDYAIRVLGAKPESVYVVCHGISDRFANPISDEKKNDLRRKYGINPKSLIIGYVGRVTKDKGLDLLVDAIKESRPLTQFPEVHLVFVGDYYVEGDQEWMEEIIQGAGSQIKISLVPFQDPKPFYDIFDIFVLPSKSEAFGLVCVEAMMSACCTVRTDTNGAADQMTHGKDGFIFPNGNTRALALILKQISSNCGLKEAIEKNGKEKALNNFTIKAMTKKTLEVYKTLS